MTCYSATGGTLKPAGAWVPPRKVAMTCCRACGGGFPTTHYLRSGGRIWEGHARACSKRPLEVSLDNVRRFAERPSAAYHLDWEFDHIKKLLLP